MKLPPSPPASLEKIFGVKSCMRRIECDRLVQPHPTSSFSHKLQPQD